MTLSKYRNVTILGALLALGGVASAQQPGDATTPPSAPAPNASAPPPSTPTSAAATAAKPPAKPDPSAEVLKKARENGYRAKLRRGQTLFCREETEIGSHFSKENCIDENQLEVVLLRRQEQRDQMSNHTCSNGGACSGK
jgi:hypothetical protein